LLYIHILFFILFFGKLIYDYKNPEVDTTKALKQAMVWYGLFYVFPLAYYLLGEHSLAQQWVTAYNVETALSFDNLAVISSIIVSFNLNSCQAKQVLSYGIWGAVIMRIVLLSIGVGFLTKISFIAFPLFGLFLADVGLMKLLGHEDGIIKSFIAKVLGKLGLTSKAISNWKPVHSLAGMLGIAPLLIPAIAQVEVTDLIFAVDSIPAVLALSSNLMVVITSNLAAIAFLRQMYFAFEQLAEKFEYLERVGVSGALIVIGFKLIAYPLGLHIDPLLSLVLVLTPLVFSVLLSLSVAKITES